MPTIHRNAGPSLHYEIDDYTDPWKNLPYLILQHGNGRSSQFWYSWVPYLSRFYKVVRPDVRGLGRSSAEFDLEKDFTLEHCVDDLLAIVDALGADSVHVCGESVGGMLGVAFAATHPERVRTLTMVATPVHLDERMKDLYSFGHATRLDAIREMGRDAWLAATNKNTRFPPGTDPGLLDWYNREYASNSADVQAAMATLVDGASIADYLARIEAPVLGLYPMNGPRTGAEQERVLQRHIRDFSLVHLPSSFHKIQLTHVASCATQVLHFVSRHDGTPCTEH